MEQPATLRDYLREGLDVVFVGLNPSRYSVESGHYFANPRNRFWPALNRSSLVGREMASPDDANLLSCGIGFTDVVKRPTPQASGLRAADFRRWAPELKDNLLRFKPLIACFHGVTAYSAYLKYAEGINERVGLGRQQRKIGQTHVFVVPNPSPANAVYSTADLTRWYDRLAQLRDELAV